MTKYVPQYDEFAHSARPLTKTTHRDVYPAVDPSQPALALPCKTVLVTGAGRGIGVAIAEAFAKANVQNIILVGRSDKSLESSKALLSATYPSIKLILRPTDIGKPESVNALFESLKADGVDKIDILVNNAAVLSEFGPKLGETDVEKWWSDFEINSRGPYLLARGLLNFNTPDYPATFIGMTSGSIAEGLGSLSGYTLSKLVPVKMVELLDAEYPNLRAFIFAPGVVMTDMTLDAFKPFALDSAALSGALSVWLSSPKAEFLRGRFLTVHWDVSELEEQQEAILAQNKLKVRVSGWSPVFA